MNIAYPQNLLVISNMEATGKVSMFLSFIICFCTIIVAGEDKCSYATCGKEDPEIQFPFTLEDQQDSSCGYPGFNLSCSKSNETVLDLGASGEFMVRFIDYETQEIQIYDQDDCLPKRLMNFDLTGTPFKYYYYQNFDFYNCSSNISSEYLEPISCLSTPNYTVYAALSYFGPPTRYIIGVCRLFYTVMVPISELYHRAWDFTDANADLRLRWDAPSCGACFARGGTCRFKNRSKNETGCSNLPGRGLSRTAKYVLGIGLGGLGLLFLVLMVCYVSGRCNSLNHSNNLRHTELSSSPLPQTPIFIRGFREAVIQSYPKVVLGESLRLAKPEDNICAICLSEYRAKETLKTVPECKHCFHAACIDQWLRRNITCPLCRNTPPQFPIPPPA